MQTFHFFLIRSRLISRWDRSFTTSFLQWTPHFSQLLQWSETKAPLNTRNCSARIPRLFKPTHQLCFVSASKCNTGVITSVPHFISISYVQCFDNAYLFSHVTKQDYFILLYSWALWVVCTFQWSLCIYFHAVFSFMGDVDIDTSTSQRVLFTWYAAEMGFHFIVEMILQTSYLLWTCSSFELWSSSALSSFLSFSCLVRKHKSVDFVTPNIVATSWICCFQFQILRINITTTSQWLRISA